MNNLNHSVFIDLKDFLLGEPLLRAIARIKRLAMSFRKFKKKSETFVSPVTPDELSQSELFIVKQVQRE